MKCLILTDLSMLDQKVEADAKKYFEITAYE